MTLIVGVYRSHCTGDFTNTNFENVRYMPVSRRSSAHEFGVHQLLACFLSRPGLEAFESVLLFKSLDTNCSLWSLKHLDLLKLSANPLVDVVDDVVYLMAVHSLRSAAIFFEQFFGHVEPWCSLLFPFGRLTCKGLFSCALVSNTQILLSPYFQIFRVTWTCPPHSCTESLVQVEGQRACRLDNQCNCVVGILGISPTTCGVA